LPRAAISTVGSGTDSRFYGGSGKSYLPTPTTDHWTPSATEMPASMRELVEELGRRLDAYGLRLAATDFRVWWP
jgi:hypothetical protein